MQKKFKHKKLGWIAKEYNGGNFYIVNTNKEGLANICKELIEDSDDWIEIKEEKKFLRNGMEIDYNKSNSMIRTSIYFDTSANRDVWDKKMEAYLKIMKRCEEINGDWETDRFDGNHKYFICYDFERDRTLIDYLYHKTKCSDFILKEIPKEIPTEIQDAVKTYFTS